MTPISVFSFQFVCLFCDKYNNCTAIKLAGEGVGRKAKNGHAEDNGLYFKFKNKKKDKHKLPHG